MANILISPSKYVQGAGELKKLGAYAEKYGKKALDPHHCFRIQKMRRHSRGRF